MLAAFALCAATAFPESPLVDQVAMGRKIATAGRQISLADVFGAREPRSTFNGVWGNERQVIGWWANGYIQRPVEFAVWLSPALLSRWLGFLSAREYWDDGELTARWKSIAAQVKDRRYFVVQLTAFPKMPLYGVGDYELTSPEEIEDVRFVYTAGGKSQRMQAARLAAWQSREREDLEGFPWWQQIEFGDQLTGEFENGAREEPLCVGDYYRAWYLAWVEGADEDLFQVRVLSRRKERAAFFTASK